MLDAWLTFWLDINTANLNYEMFRDSSKPMFALILLVVVTLLCSIFIEFLYSLIFVEFQAHTSDSEKHEAIEMESFTGGADTSSNEEIYDESEQII